MTLLAVEGEREEGLEVCQVASEGKPSAALPGHSINSVTFCVVVYTELTDGTPTTHRSLIG